MPKTTHGSEKGPLLCLVFNFKLLYISTFTCVCLGYRCVYLSNLVSYCSFPMCFALLLFLELQGVEEHSCLFLTPFRPQNDFAMRQAQNGTTGMELQTWQRSG